MAYVVDSYSDRVSVIRTSDHTVVATVDVGSLSTDVAFPHESSPSRRRKCPGPDPFGPGFWATHPERWPPTPYLPDAPSERFFGGAFAAKTLLEVLNLPGGGLNALGRHATAALLNAAAAFVEFPLIPDDVTGPFACAVSHRDPRDD